MPLDDTEEETFEVAQTMMAVPADEYPHLIEFTIEHILNAGYD